MALKWNVNCEEATSICNKSQYREASLLDKIKLNLHLFFCKYCRKYSAQNSHMTKVLEQHLKDNCKNQHLTKSEKEAMEACLKTELHKELKD